MKKVHFSFTLLGRGLGAQNVNKLFEKLFPRSGCIAFVSDIDLMSK